MTIFMLAIYRAARQLMTDDELRRAEGLANDADSGSTAAALMLRMMAIEVLTDRHRIERAKAAGGD